MLRATWITVLHLIATFLGILLKNVRFQNLSFDIYLKNHNVTVFKCQMRIKLYSYLYKYQMNGCFLWYLGFWKGRDQVRYISWQRLVLQHSKAIPHTCTLRFVDLRAQDSDVGTESFWGSCACSQHSTLFLFPSPNSSCTWHDLEKGDELRYATFQVSTEITKLFYNKFLLRYNNKLCYSISHFHTCWNSTAKQSKIKYTWIGPVEIQINISKLCMSLKQIGLLFLTYQKTELLPK